jgi:hypothetical protein
MAAYTEALTNEQVEKYTHDDDGCLPAHRCHPDTCRDTRVGTLAREVQRLTELLEAIDALPDTTEVVHVGRQSRAAQLRAAHFEAGYASAMRQVKALIHPDVEGGSSE